MEINTYHELGVTRFIGQTVNRQGQGGPAQGIHVSHERAHVSVNVVRPRKAIAVGSIEDLEADIVSTFRENNTHNHTLILDTFSHLRSLNERGLEDIGVGVDTRGTAQERSKVVVPSNAEAVVPASEDGVTGLQLQTTSALTNTWTVAAGRNIADIINEVRVDRAGKKRICQLTDRRSRRFLVVGVSPLDARELVGQLRAVVAEPVPFLGCKVAAPVRDLQVTLQKVYGDYGLSELVAHGNWVLGARGHLGGVIRTVSVCRALALGVRAGLETISGCVIRHIGTGELQLGLLGIGRVGGWHIGGEGVGKVLLVRLSNGRGKRAERGKYRVRDSKGNLRLRGQRLGKMNDEVLVAAVSIDVRIRVTVYVPRPITRLDPWRGHWSPNCYSLR